MSSPYLHLSATVSAALVLLIAMGLGSCGDTAATDQEVYDMSDSDPWSSDESLSITISENSASFAKDLLGCTRLDFHSSFVVQEGLVQIYKGCPGRQNGAALLGFDGEIVWTHLVPMDCQPVDAMYIGDGIYMVDTAGGYCSFSDGQFVFHPGHISEVYGALDVAYRSIYSPMRGEVPSVSASRTAIGILIGPGELQVTYRSGDGRRIITLEDPLRAYLESEVLWHLPILGVSDSVALFPYWQSHVLSLNLESSSLVAHDLACMVSSLSLLPDVIQGVSDMHGINVFVSNGFLWIIVYGEQNIHLERRSITSIHAEASCADGVS